MQKRRRRDGGARRSRKRRLCTGKRWRARGTLQGESTTYVDAASSSSLDASHPTPAPSSTAATTLEQAGARRHLGPTPPAEAACASWVWPWAMAADRGRDVVISGLGTLRRPAGSDVRCFTSLALHRRCLFARAALLHSNTLLSFLRYIHRPHPAVTTLRPLAQPSPRPSGRRNTSPSLIGRPYTNTLHFTLPFIKDSATESHAADIPPAYSQRI